MFSLQCRGIFSFFWKEVHLTHPFIIQLSTQQTSKHPFIHSSPSFKNCLLSFHIGYKCYLCHWARLRMVIDRQGTCSLCVSSRGAGNVKIVPPAPKELKSHSFFLLVIPQVPIEDLCIFQLLPAHGYHCLGHRTQRLSREQGASRWNVHVLSYTSCSPPRPFYQCTICRELRKA